MILLLAFLIPVSWLAYKQLGNPLALMVYGQQLERPAERERDLLASLAERRCAMSICAALPRFRAPPG